MVVRVVCAAPPPKPTKQKAPPKRRGSPTHVAVIQGQNAGATANLAEAPILIGRGNDAAIRLDDDYVSTRHARVVSNEDGIYAEDLGSTNGSYVNGQRITAPTTITMSDTLRIGKTMMKLEP